MSRIAYVNGRYVRHSQASVHIEDRGYQFADAVYEVWSVFGGRIADAKGHLDRLWRSLDALQIRAPMSESALLAILFETIRRNHLQEGLVYLQISRGVAPRDHSFPSDLIKPAIVITTKPVDRASAEQKARIGIKVYSAPDLRWGRCDIKTVGLLPNVLAKQASKAKGGGEAIFVDKDGFVTEGGSTNVWILRPDGRLQTRDTGANILRGVTRLNLIELARAAGYEVIEAPFTLDEMKAASEAFVTAASSFVLPVKSVDDHTIGFGRNDQIALKLRELYLERARELAY